MFVHDLIERVRQAFAPRVRDESADEAIKALHEARDAARRAARLIEGSQPRIARDLSKTAEKLSTTAKRLWSI